MSHIYPSQSPLGREGMCISPRKKKLSLYQIKPKSAQWFQNLAHTRGRTDKQSNIYRRTSCSLFCTSEDVEVRFLRKLLTINLPSLSVVTVFRLYPLRCVYSPVCRYSLTLREFREFDTRNIWATSFSIIMYYFQLKLHLYTPEQRWDPTFSLELIKWSSLHRIFFLVSTIPWSIVKNNKNLQNYIHYVSRKLPDCQKTNESRK